MRSPASETVVGAVCVPRLTRSLRRHPAESSLVRVRAFPLRLSASASGLGSHRYPPPPNNSFKPTPCRGVGRVLCATLAHVRRPATGRLNSSVRRQKSFCLLCFPMLHFSGFGWHCSSAGLSARCFFVQVRQARSHIACVALAGFGNIDSRDQLSRD